MRTTKPREAAFEETAELQNHASKIKEYWKRSRKGHAEGFGYAAMLGHEFLRAKERMPHGNQDGEEGFEKWCDQRFPSIPKRTRNYYMQFARDLADGAETLGLDFPRVFKSGKLDVRARKDVLKIVHEIMDGNSMADFMRAARILREPKEPEPVDHPKLTPDQLLAEKQKQAVQAWQRVCGDLEDAVPLARHLPNTAVVNMLERVDRAKASLESLKEAH